MGSMWDLLRLAFLVILKLQLELQLDLITLKQVQD